MRILIAEDDPKIIRILQEGLQIAHYTTDIAVDGSEACYKALTNHYAVILLDYRLPKKNGLEVLKEIRAKGCFTKVIVLTAIGDVDNKVLCLENGADDYVVKPFSFEELLARIRVQLRKQDQKNDAVLTAGDLTLDLKKASCARAGVTIHLSSQEFAILEVLLRHKNEIVTRDVLSEYVWGEDAFGFTNKIEVYISYLRTKIDKSFEPKIIKTVRGKGYMLSDHE